MMLKVIDDKELEKLKSTDVVVSIRAGGEGVNLQSASVAFSLSWTGLLPGFFRLRTGSTGLVRRSRWITTT